MQFIEWLKSCFEILFPCGCILLLVHGFLIAKHTSASSIQTTDNKESSDWLLVIYNLISMIVLILVIYYFASIKGYKWLWLILVIPSLIQYANAILHSANEVGSDRRIVALSSRIAIVTTLVSIVVMNQIDPIFKNSTSSTAILEFIASTIIIPLVFEWISSMHATPSRDKEPE